MRLQVQYDDKCLKIHLVLTDLSDSRMGVFLKPDSGLISLVCVEIRGTGRVLGIVFSKQHDRHLQ